MRLVGTALVLGYYAALGCVPAAVVLGVIEPALQVVSGPVPPRPRRPLPRR